MELNLSVMDELERIGFLLRGLYQENGFIRYRMSKFEEYDLYSRNKDFLLSQGVITFTDPGGSLLALKPDVTLSIVKNTPDCGPETRKLYYHENVYRVSAGAEGFREETQVGVECMGQVDAGTLTEILRLAAESLRVLSPGCILEISQLDILSRLTDGLTSDEAIRRRILACAQQKNIHGIREICREAGLPGGAEDDLATLLTLDGIPGRVLPRVRSIAEKNGCGSDAAALEEILAPLAGTDLESCLLIDFSGAANLKYYNGIVFQGFLKGIPDPVLSGGQYDKLMTRMRRKDRAVGFAVFLDRLDLLSREGGRNE